MLEQIKLFLQPFANALEVLEGDKYATLGMFYPYLCIVKQSLERDQPLVRYDEEGLQIDIIRDQDILPEIKSFRAMLLTELNRRFFDLTKVIKDRETSYEELSHPFFNSLPIVVTTILDPYFKHLGFLNDIQVHYAYQLFMKELIKTTQNRPNNFIHLQTFPFGHIPCNYQKGIFSSFNLLPHLWTPRSHQAQKFITTNEELNIEFQKYLHMEVVPDLHIPALYWWKENHNQFPQLSLLVRLYYSIPATSASSERAFSEAGNILTPLRNSLKPDKVRAIMFLRNNCPTEQEFLEKLKFDNSQIMQGEIYEIEEKEDDREL